MIQNFSGQTVFVTFFLSSISNIVQSFMKIVRAVSEKNDKLITNEDDLIGPAPTSVGGPKITEILC